MAARSSNGRRAHAGAALRAAATAAETSASPATAPRHTTSPVAGLWETSVSPVRSEGDMQNLHALGYAQGGGEGVVEDHGTVRQKFQPPVRGAKVAVAAGGDQHVEAGVSKRADLGDGGAAVVLHRLQVGDVGGHGRPGVENVHIALVAKALLRQEGIGALPVPVRAADGGLGGGRQQARIDGVFGHQVSNELVAVQAVEAVRVLELHVEEVAAQPFPE